MNIRLSLLRELSEHTLRIEIEPIAGPKHHLAFRAVWAAAAMYYRRIIASSFKNLGEKGLPGYSFKGIFCVEDPWN